MCRSSHAADYPGMEPVDPEAHVTPQDSLDAEQHVVDITRMSHDSARTYMDFHTGMRWLRRPTDDVVAKRERHRRRVGAGAQRLGRRRSAA